MLQSIVRFSLTMLFAWLVAKGVVTQSQVDSDLPTIVQFATLAVYSAAILFWSWAEKYFKGHITFTGQNVPPVSNINLVVPPITNKTETTKIVPPTDPIDK